MKTEKEILEQSGISDLAYPDTYAYPNSAVDAIKKAYYVTGYKKAQEHAVVKAENDQAGLPPVIEHYLEQMESYQKDMATLEKEEMETSPLMEEPILSKEDCIDFLTDMVADLENIRNQNLIPDDIESVNRSIEFNNSLLYHLTN